MCKPTPAWIQNEASDDKDHPEVLITLQPNQQAQQLHQQPQNLAPQQQPQQPVPQQPVQFQSPTIAIGGGGSCCCDSTTPTATRRAAIHGYFLGGGSWSCDSIISTAARCAAACGCCWGGPSHGCNPTAPTAAWRVAAPPAAAQATTASPIYSRGSALSSTASVSVENSN